MSTLTIWDDIRGWVINAWSTVRINRVGSGSEVSILSIADANTKIFVHFKIQELWPVLRCWKGFELLILDVEMKPFVSPIRCKNGFI